VPETTREPESIGARVRRLRRERGLSQRDLSEPGVSYAYVSRIEAGARQPSLKAIRILAGKLGVSPEYLETGAGTPKAYEQEIRLSDAELGLRLGEAVEQAEETFRQLLAEARDAADLAAETRSRIGLGLALGHRGRNAEAIVQLERADESPAVTPASRPDVYAALGRCYTALGETRRAITLYERCLAELTDVAPDDRALAFRFRSLLSSALADAGAVDRAREVLAEVAGQAGSGLDARARVNLYWSLARIASKDDEPVGAMMYMRRAIGLLEASEDTRELARAHLHVTEMLMLDDEAERAGPHLEHADRLLELGGDHGDLGALRTQQAHRAVRLRAPEEAIRLAREALDDLAERPGEQGSAWHALAAAQALTGDVEAASESFARAVELLREAGEWREAMTAYRMWAQVLREAGRNQEAFEIIEQATLLTLRNAGTLGHRSQRLRR
jgi:transcriptional regulator with XRE-family HTH domain